LWHFCPFSHVVGNKFAHFRLVLYFDPGMMVTLTLNEQNELLSELSLFV